jgi:uncharacterized membrane protein (UPF0127 family)
VEHASRPRDPLRLSRRLWPSSFALCLACDWGGARQGSAEATQVPATALDPAGAVAEGGAAEPALSADGTARSGAACVTPRREPPPPVATPAAQCPADPETPPNLPSGQVRFSDAPGSPSVSVELAVDDTARTRGLMYRTAMDADRGMLFSWPREEPRSFWMRNTCIPLDMLFIAADGTIVGILEQVPTLNTAPRSVPCPAQHVLEVNAGWTRAHGVEPGQRVDLDT